MKLSKERREYYFGDNEEYYEGFLTDVSMTLADLMGNIQENLDQETMPQLKKALKQSQELTALIEDAIATLKKHKENKT